MCADIAKPGVDGDELVAFLEARYKEKAARARAMLVAAQIPGYRWPTFYSYGLPAADDYWQHDCDPGRALQRILAMQALLALHSDPATAQYPCETLFLMAVEFSTHPDYRADLWARHLPAAA